MMIKLNFNYIFLISFLFALSPNFAQEEIKTWKDGPLTWEDFQEKNSVENIYVFSYQFEYDTLKEKINDTVVNRFSTKAYMVKNESFIHPDFKTESKLRHLQVIFNILEIHRRKLQYRLDNLKNYVDLSSAYNETRFDCEKEIKAFTQLSNKGERLDVIQKWEIETTEKLKTLPEYKLPVIENKGFGYGLHGGFGTSTFSGGLEEYFNPSFNIGFGFEVGYNRHLLFINGILGFTRIKQDYMGEGKWLEGNRANLAVIDLSYGYSVYENSTLKITPFAGLGITEFTTEHENEVQEDYRFVDYNLAYGLQTDFKIRRKLNLIPNPALNVKEYVESSIKVRLFMTQAKFNEDISGNTINLGIEYSVFGRFFK
jgi:hypothetical protein